MLDCIAIFLEKYQIIFTGIIGFLGVIITISMNSKISRDQDYRNIDHKKNSLRIALYTELSLLLSSYKLRIEQLNNINGRSALIRDYDSNQIYLKMLPEIGLLSKSEIETVMTAYQLNNELLFRLGVCTGSLELSKNQGYVKVTMEYVQVVVDIHSEFLKAIEAALEELNYNIK